MERDLEGKVALVTGGSGGIGRATCRAFAARGANVVFTYFRNRSEAETTQASIEDEGAKSLMLKAHLGEVPNVSKVFDEVEEAFGRLDIFVSNAASGVIKPVAELDARAWDWTMNANARPLFLGALRCRELMKDGGQIIALTSLGSVRVLPGYSIVGASKAAIEALVRYLAVEFAEAGIRVNAVSPGVVDTRALKAFPMRADMISFQEKSPMAALITPESVADSVMFLTSAAATQITGHTLTVDAGAALPWMETGGAH